MMKLPETTTERARAIADMMESFGMYTLAREVIALAEDRDLFKGAVIELNEWFHSMGLNFDDDASYPQ